MATLPTTSSSTNLSASYSDKLQNKPRIIPITEITHPTDDQAFVFNCISDYKIRDYLIALKDLVGGPKNMVAVSKVSKNRIIIHLSSSELVDNLLSQHGGFKIEDSYIKCRKLRAPVQKIVLSHVNPNIPNSLLEDFVTNELKLSLTSNITFLRFNPIDQLFGHMISWRRQFYTNSDLAKIELPGSFLVNHNDQEHRIFLNVDEFSCFKCHEKGHRAENCTMEDEIALDDEPFDMDTSEPPGIDTSSILSESSFPALPPTHSSSQPTQDDPPIQSIQSSSNAPTKRPPSSVSSQPTSLDPPPNPHENNSNRTPPKPPKKKVKKSARSRSRTPNSRNSQTDSDPEDLPNKISTKESLKPIEKDITNRFKTSDFPVSFTNFTILMDMVKSRQLPEVQNVLSEFRISPHQLLPVLNDNYSSLNDRSMKTRFTKLKNLLETMTNSTESQQ